MNDEQHQALLTELRALRREVSGVRLASRVIAALLILAIIAVTIQFSWFRDPLLILLMIGLACGTVWIVFSVCSDIAKSRMTEKAEAIPPNSSSPRP